MKAGGRQASRKEKLENLMNEFVSRRGWCSTSTGTRDDAASYLFLLILLLVFLFPLRSSPSPVSFSKLPLYSPLPCFAPPQTPCHPPLFIDLVVLLLDHLADSNLSTPSYSSSPSILPWPWSPTTMTRGIEPYAHQMKYRIDKHSVTATLIVPADAVLIN